MTSTEHVVPELWRLRQVYIRETDNQSFIERFTALEHLARKIDGQLPRIITLLNKDLFDEVVKIVRQFAILHLGGVLSYF